MSEPMNPQNEPYSVEFEECNTYSWCVCRRSKNQIFSDGTYNN
jgi:hypothetical protein